MTEAPVPALGPRLAIDASRMASERTGIENYLHHLLPWLVADWRGAGGDAVVFARDPSVADHVEPPVEVIAGGGPGWTQLRLPTALRRAGADVYFSPIPVLPLLRKVPCPAVVTVHDLIEFRARWWYFRRLIGRSLERAAGVIVVSGATEAELVEAFPQARGQAVVAREAADPAVFHEGPAAREHQGDAAAGTDVLARLDLAGPPILAVGTIQPRKNYAALLRAYASLHGAGTAVAGPEALPPVVIVGRQGWDYEEVLGLPSGLGIGDRVQFTGHLPEADVAALMRSSLLLAAVSTSEGFGLPLVEAMYSGLPILASDIPPFREVAGNAALFVNPNSVDDIAAGLARLLADPGLRARLAEAGRGRRALFSWEAAAKEIGATLRRAMRPPAAATGEAPARGRPS